MQGNDRSLAARAAWLSFIGGYTQEEIAQRLGLSRVKINRLIAEATEAGLVRVFVEGNDGRVRGARGSDRRALEPGFLLRVSHGR